MLIEKAIATERLLLSLLKEEDHTFIIELLNSEGWLQFIGERNVRSKEDAIAYIQKINHNPNITYWTVTEKTTQQPIGLVTLIQRDYLNEPDIGFAFLPQAGGKGYAYEAAKAVLDAISGEGKLSAIYAVTLPANTASIKLIEKLGLAFNKKVEIEKEELSIYSVSLK
ncbi:MAG: GNAT family N-acetyltransferase [Rhizobacter sp.]|nr:GNAT family N-acetyltransferase [Ferruginibacter sp.]